MHTEWLDKGNKNSERKENFSERYRWLLKHIAMSKEQTTVVKVTTELNQHLDSPPSMITVRRQFHKHNNYGRAAISMPFVTDVNGKHRLQ
ncbi:hypothetical protein TNCV_1125021 [Trichonephila clavipes]|uniref:Uncharacterized protein n=1 Tax=Trichonephila clavipes TaxID=2585209 RepID=A0A8X6SEY2_TRICX|nr:hypothetical protein TNCV_1125021 [Trichonephila clavipes]